MLQLKLFRQICIKTKSGVISEQKTKNSPTTHSKIASLSSVPNQAIVISMMARSKRRWRHREQLCNLIQLFCFAINQQDSIIACRFKYSQHAWILKPPGFKRGFYVCALITAYWKVLNCACLGLNIWAFSLGKSARMPTKHLVGMKFCEKFAQSFLERVKKLVLSKLYWCAS